MERELSIVFCPTVPQSGTWFVLRFFEKLGCKIEHASEIIKRDSPLNLDSSRILHAHIFPFYYNPSPYKEAWPSFGEDPIQEYIVRKNKLSIGGIKLLCNMYKTIIPIRDPLASLLTREARAPNLRHFYIVDAYVEVARTLSRCLNVMFLPVDLNLRYKERRNLLRKVVQHCGFNPDEHSEAINVVAKYWEKENVTPNNRFHKPYAEGDFDTIREWLGQKWAEVVHLKNFGAILVPFLSSLGYNEKKTLLWC